MSDNLPNDFQGSIAPTSWVSSGEPDSSIVSSIEAAVLLCQQAAASAAASAAAAASDASTPISVPSELNATGTPSSATYLRGDGTWSTPVSSAADYDTLTNKPTNFPADWNTTVANKPTTFPPSAHNQAVSTLSDIVLAAIRTFLTSPDLATARTALDITKTNIGLGNVDNTSDANKPISTQTQLAFRNVRIPWYQVGSSYPTPLPDRNLWFGFEFIGVNDPADQVGITVVTERDAWFQPNPVV